MRSLIPALALLVAACGVTHFGLQSDATSASSPAKAETCCASECQLAMQHLPNGHCLITCTGANGEHCEIELARIDGHCQVVRDECGDCCPTASEHVEQMLSHHD